jgi:hypothetical protein
MNNFPLNNYFKDYSEIKVKFINGTIPFDDTIHVNPAFWILKSWYKKHGKNNSKIKWLDCIHHNIDLCENYIKKIIDFEKPNIICFGLYIWNYDLYS